VDDIRFIVQEAAAVGLKVAAHCWTDAGARNAAEAGVASIEHGFAMSDEVLELAKKNGVVLAGTEFTRLTEREMGAPGWHATMVDRLRRAYRIGVTMAFGTDIMFGYRGETRGTLAMQQIDSWVEAGISPRDTLKAMIPNAVKLLGVDGERGAIRAGQAADIIATPENPLDNIQTLKRVMFVMKDGAVVRNDRASAR
jgi:imidazolonepropionase-like amidohydrolase